MSQTYFLWDKENRGPCRVATHFKDWPVSEDTRPLLEDGAEIFIRYNEGVSILRKVVSRETGQDKVMSLPEAQRFGRLVSSRKPFGLETKFKGSAKKQSADDLMVHQNGGVGYTPRSAITTGLGLIDAWKLFVGYAAPGTGNRDTYPQVNWDLVVFDEYHFGAWRETAKELFEGEEEAVAKKEAKLEYDPGLDGVNEDLSVLSNDETEFLPITSRAYLYLSGTPFKALATGEFIEEQIFNWTYTDEQRAKVDFAAKHPDKWNPYGALPQMRLLTYQMPDELLAIASAGEFDEFDLNEFFSANGIGTGAQFKHKDDVQKWLDIIRGQYAPRAVESLKTGTRPGGRRRGAGRSR